MAIQGRGEHHFHRRKRIYLHHEPYPHPNKWKRLMDNLIYFVGIVGPVMTIPQVTKIWIDKNSQGVSVVSWATYTILSVFWLIYGIMHKEKPIIFTSSQLFIFDALVVIGAVIYR